MATVAQQFWREVLDPRQPADPGGARTRSRPKKQLLRVRTTRVETCQRRAW